MGSRPRTRAVPTYIMILFDLFVEYHFIIGSTSIIIIVLVVVIGGEGGRACADLSAALSVHLT